jgi:predicted transposase YbfD/YdcC
MDKQSPLEHFRKVDDPRQEWKVEHKLFDIILLTVSAVIAGAETWDQISDFGRERLSWLKKYGDFENGIPTHFTIARVLGRIDPEQFQSCFIDWMQSCEFMTGGSVVAIDGKTVRGSYNKNKSLSAIHMVSAFCTKNNQVIGQIKTEEKSNEITAIPALLKLLDLQESLVTIDAMGCQTKIAQAIVDKEADYLLAVKANQSRLHNKMAEKLSCSAINNIAHESQQYYQTEESNRGRSEVRQYFTFDLFDEFIDLSFEWPSMKKLCVALSFRKMKGEISSDYCVRYYISSADLSARDFGESVRAHWGIENRLHWMLDVGMREDACLISRDNAAENLSGARRIALNLLKRDTSRKGGVSRKQKMAAMNESYLSQVIEGY